MRTYIDFVEMLTSDIGLLGEFQTLIQKCSADQLSQWFKNAGYDVGIAECGVLLNNRTANYLIRAAMLPY